MKIKEGLNSKLLSKCEISTSILEFRSSTDLIQTLNFIFCLIAKFRPPSGKKVSYNNTHNSEQRRVLLRGNIINLYKPFLYVLQFIFIYFNSYIRIAKHWFKRRLFWPSVGCKVNLAPTEIARMCKITILHIYLYVDTLQFFFWISVKLIHIIYH